MQSDSRREKDPRGTVNLIRENQRQQAGNQLKDQHQCQNRIEDFKRLSLLHAASLPSVGIIPGRAAPIAGQRFSNSFARKPAGPPASSRTAASHSARASAARPCSA
jgi:hypothetical protein